MALSGSALGAKKGGWRITMNWSATQNVTANTSAISWQVKLVADSTWRINSGSFNGSITINGTTTGFSKNPSTNGGATILLGSGTTTVPHNSDGSKSCGISFTYNLGIYSNSLGGTVGALSGSTTASLNKIARASSMSWVAADSPHEFGKTQRFVVTAASASYYHGIEMRVNGVWDSVLLLDSQGGGTKSIVIPLDTMKKFPNTSKATGLSFRLITYTSKGAWNGLIGYKDYALSSCNFPDNIVPTLTEVTTKDTSTVPAKIGVTAEKGLFVEGLSTIRFDVGASGTYGSTISEYSFMVDGKTFTNKGTPYDLACNTSNFTGTGLKNFTVGIKDSRGRTATKDISVNVTPYSTISLGNFSATRNSEEESRVDVVKTANVSSIKNGATELNKFLITTEYKLATDTAWTIVKTENDIKTSTIKIINADVTKSFDVRVSAKDKLSSVSAIGTISTARVLIDLFKDVGIGLGKMYEENHGVLDVGGDSYFRGDTLVTGTIKQNGRALIDIFYPIGTIYESVNSENPSSFMGGTWERFGNGRVTVGVDENDADFSAPGVTAGAKDSELRALIGAYNNDVRTLAYAAGSPVAGEGHRSLWLKGMSNDPASAVTRINHTVLVKGTDGKNMPRTQPSIAVYRWRRTA